MGKGGDEAFPNGIPKTTSMFGSQVSSTKPSTAAYGFGTAPRMPSDKLYITKAQTKKSNGKGSPGPIYNMGSSLGGQPTSKNVTAPGFAFGSKVDDQRGLLKQPNPGPGSYLATDSIGKQVSSKKNNEAAWKFGTGDRWGNYKPKEGGQFKPNYSTPAAGNPQLPAGALGDAPAYSFFGTGGRYQLGKGVPGCNPTYRAAPGPGTYQAPSSLGSQAASLKETSQNVKFGTSQREKQHKVYLTHAHERELIGQHSPAPNVYTLRSSIGSQVTSKNPSSSNTKFGSGDRFSELKSAGGSPAKMLPTLTPGPGSYGV